MGDVTGRCLNCESRFLLSEDMLKCPRCTIQRLSAEVGRAHEAIVTLWDVAYELDDIEDEILEYIQSIVTAADKQTCGQCGSNDFDEQSRCGVSDCAIRADKVRSEE